MLTAAFFRRQNILMQVRILPFLCAIFFSIFSPLIINATAAAETEMETAAQPVTLSFIFKYNGIKAAEVRDVFEPLADGSYKIESHAAAVGLAKILYGDVNRKSSGRLSAEFGLQTQHYWQQRGSKPVQQADYDVASRKIHLQKKGEMRDEIVAADTPLLDYLTALYRPYILGKATAGKFAITDGWRLRIYEYEIGEPAKITTPAGEFNAVPLRRESPRGERVFWVSPDLNYLPVKIYIDDKGHVFETLLTEVIIGNADNESDKP